MLLGALPVGGETGGPSGGSARIEIEPGARVTRTLAGDGKVDLTVVAPPGIYRVVIDQLGLDVTATIRRQRSGESITIDRPFDRDGSEVLVIEVPSTGVATIDVRGLTPSAPPGAIGVVVEAIEGPAKNEILHAEHLEMSAATAYARAATEGWRSSLKAFQQAAEAWDTAGDARRAARARYAVGVLHRLLRETREALPPMERALTGFAALGEPRWQASAHNELGLGRITLGELDRAEAHFERALALLSTDPDPYRQAHACSNRCLVAFHRSELRQGIDCYQGCQPLYDEARDVQAEAVAKTNCGRAFDVLGEPDRALAAYVEALALQRTSGDRHGEALTLNNLAFLRQAQGEIQRALTLYAEAEAIYRALEDKQGLARVLNNQGFALLALGEVSRARALFGGALALRRAVEDKDGEAFTLTNLARAYSLEGDREGALDHYRQALALRRSLDDRRGEGLVLLRLGRERSRGKELSAAWTLLSQAESIFRDLGDRGSLAAVALEKGRAAIDADRLGDAKGLLEESLDLHRSTRNRAGEVAVLHQQARLARRRGAVLEANAHVASAIAMIEDLRYEIDDAELRAAFFATRRAIHELQIDLTMARHEADPEAGHDRVALAASERARARSFLDQLSDSRLRRPTDPDGEDSALVTRARSLRYQLDRAVRRRRALAASPLDAETESRTTALDLEIESLLAGLERIDREMRRARPGTETWSAARPLEADEIQDAVDEDTLLLSYFSGKHLSWLWLVGIDRIEAFSLPSRSTIASAARRVHERISILDPGDASSKADLSVLSELVLGDVASRLVPGKRLVIVADGALNYVPFGALPIPGPGSSGAGLSGAGTGGVRLIERHEIVSVPSISSLATLRRQRRDRTRAQATRPQEARPQEARPQGRSGRRRALVIADPVFSAQDPRMAPGLKVAGGVESDGRDGSRSLDADLARLPASGREATIIASLAPENESLARGDRPAGVDVRTGFDAMREAMLGDRLLRYEVLHFATHGLIDDRVPRLSGLALSLVDRTGQPIDGVLRRGDIAQLELDAELVVLSGCRTALGREIRGEGLVGLTRAFMFAGARRVIASLWQVSDRATAVLMERFYRALWIDGESPGRALQTAQLSMLADRRYRDPFYWSGFVLQGDWRDGG